MFDQLIAGVADVWTLPALVAATFGGAVMGVAVERAAIAGRSPRALTIAVAAVGTLSVAVFWSGQIVDGLISGDPNWGRAVGRALLQTLFVLSTAVAAGVLRRRDQQSPLTGRNKGVDRTTLA